MSHKTTLAFFLLTLSLICPASDSRAATFNPENIITDEQLQDWQSMDRAGVRAFLRNRNSYLTDWITEDSEGKNRYASEIIYQAARNYQINPKYILVKLQKEQSLITSPAPTQRQLDWAAGYGACDSCDTTDPKLGKYKGFGKQVDSAAGIMRWYYDHAGEEQWIKKPNVNYTIDNTTITPANQATAFLYTYTPHLHGNENFFKLWHDWFQQVYPNGTLLKSTTSSTVYVVQDGQKRPIKSMAVLASRFNPKLLVTAPEDEVNQYTLGRPIIFPNYSILKVDGTYYLLDDDTARPFESHEVVRQFGYNPDEIIDATSDDISAYRIGETITTATLYPLGRLVKLDGTTNLYYLKDGAYYSIASPEIAKAKFPTLTAKKITAKDFDKYENKGALLLSDGTLLGSNLTKRIYVIEKGKKRAIDSDKTFAALGYKLSNTIWLDDIVLDQYTNGEPMYAPELKVDQNTTSTVKNLSLQMVKKKTTVVKKTVAKKIIKKSAVAKPTSYLAYFTPQDSQSPYPFTEVGKMFAAATSTTNYVGTEKLATKIDTYLVAEYSDQGLGIILAGKNIDTPRPLASFTKVMTGYRLFEDQIDLDNSVAYNPAIHAARYGNLFPIKRGDIIANRDLFYSFIVSSFNTPALMMIDSLNRTESDFVAEMNQQAKEWGLKHTFFYDSYGVNVRNQTTARDYAILFTKSLQNPILFEYLATTKYEYSELASAGGSAFHSDINSNRLMLKVGKSYTILASKTGYLNEAGFGITMLIERVSDGKKFLIITMGNPDYASKYSETDRLTNWALTLF